MSRLGRWCAAGAIVLGLVTVATWRLGNDTEASPQEASPDGTDAPTTDAETSPQTSNAAVSPPAESALPASPITLDGADLFVAKGCASCHVGPDTQPFAGGFPPLDNASLWADDRKPGMTAEEYLTESMVNPSAFRSPAWYSSGGPTDGMPTLFLSEAEVDALVAYLLAE